jgi:hypothetical protein
MIRVRLVSSRGLLVIHIPRRGTLALILMVIQEGHAEEEATVVDTVVVDMVEDTVVEDTVVEDTVVEDTVVEDTVVEDTVVEVVLHLGWEITQL